jgi:putative ABC transport system permease protein
MLRNYLKIALRNLRRNPAYTTTNLLGLGLGMACATVIFAIVSYHLSFDTFHADSDRVYRIVAELHREEVSYSAGVPGPLGKQFRNDYPFAESVARIVVFDKQLISVQAGNETKKFTELAGVGCAEPAFFDIFQFPLVQGDKRTALAEPNTALITQRLAQKYFGTSDVLGKTLRWNNQITLRITGVLANLPANTDQQQEIYTAFATMKATKDEIMNWLASDNSWGGIFSGSQCYLKLKAGVSVATVEGMLPAFTKKHQTYANPAPNRFNKYLLQPLADVHFDGRFSGRVEKKYLLTLGLIGLFLIITACLNFINLATAQALNRSKEVGVRKVLGSLKSQLFWQFMAETALLTGVSAMLAYGLAQVAMPFVNEWFKAHISLNLAQNWPLLLFMLGLSGAVVFLAGAYPGLVLAGFQPILALRGKISQRHIGGVSLRKMLVVGQFVISQLLIIGTLVVTSQMRYARQSDLGFNKDAVVLLPLPEAKKAPISTLRNQLAQLPAVENVSFCAAAPASGQNFTTGFQYDTRAASEAFNINLKQADDQFLNTFKLRLLAGRNLMPSDTVREYVVNETTVRKLGLTAPEAILGKTMKANGVPGTIVGVVKDFHNLSFHETIEPLCITTSLTDYGVCAVKINLGNVPQTLAALEKSWNSVYPTYAYDYQFLDDHIAEFYELEALMLRLIQAFAFIALFIGALGLYGLVRFSVAQRTKEIGVRKVLGASVMSIIWQLDRQFLGLVLVAFLVAAPLGWWAMNAWLSGFTYHIAIGPAVFGLAMGGTLLLTAAVVSFQSVKAALMNPVKSLRSE